MDIELAKQVGLAAAYKGAEVLRSRFGKLKNVNKKGRTDLVTEADTESERVIIQTLRAAFPTHSILAEETGRIEGIPDHQWIIDPLDGTTNFAHGLHIFCVSIAYAVEGEIVLGVVLSPHTEELFTAQTGNGARLNNRLISVSSDNTVSDSLLVTGFPYDIENAYTSNLGRFSNCLKVAQAVRRLGSAALDLCYTACGRFAGYWEQDVQPWDVAAGVLIAKEAGAIVTDYSNNPYTVGKKEILATNGNIHEEMLSLLAIEERE
jgi:myo-inositol-1(or 4)-monophosphatase